MGGVYRTVVITQGADETIVCKRGMVTKYPIVKLAKEKIVDTNGAGDAYVGGFLAGLAKGKDIEGCHKAGTFAACEIIQVSGCACAGKPAFSWWLSSFCFVRFDIKFLFASSPLCRVDP